MATKAKSKASTIPTLRDLEKRAARLRKDLEKTANRVTREAVRYIPKSSRRQFNELLEKAEDLGKTVTKRAKGVRSEVEDAVEDLRGTVDKRVKTLRKDTTDRAQEALDTIEKETRKQVERLLKAIGLPVRSDVEAIKRRVGNLERRFEEYMDGAARRRAKLEESEAA
jgi:DNA anti-recombination protein RmuC